MKWSPLELSSKKGTRKDENLMRGATNLGADRLSFD